LRVEVNDKNALSAYRQRMAQRRHRGGLPDPTLLVDYGNYHKSHFNAFTLESQDAFTLIL
jgi:hypothetical protein